MPSPKIKKKIKKNKTRRKELTRDKVRIENAKIRIIK